jgi:hypothetical protein
MDAGRYSQGTSRNTEDFASAWRELNRRHSVVRWLFLGWFLLWLFFVQHLCRRSSSLVEWAVMFIIGLMLIWAIKNPFTGLLLVSVINYATAKAHAAQVLASHNLVWVSLVLVLWFAVAAAEAHLCLFRCPNCYKRYFSFALRSTGDARHCENCNVFKGSLEPPQHNVSTAG